MNKPRCSTEVFPFKEREFKKANDADYACLAYFLKLLTRRAARMQYMFVLLSLIFTFLSPFSKRRANINNFLLTLQG